MPNGNPWRPDSLTAARAPASARGDAGAKPARWTSSTSTKLMDGRGRRERLERLFLICCLGWGKGHTHSLFGGTSRACPGLCEFLALFPLFIDYSRRRKCLHRQVTSRVMTEQPSRVARFVGRNPWSSRPCFAVRGACFEAMPGTVRKAVHMDRKQRPSLSFHCLRRCWSMCAGGAIRHRPRCANAPYVFQCIIAPRTVRWRPGARGSTWACAKPLHKNTVPSRHRRRRRRRRRRHRQAGVHTAGRRA
jgi:hypothetical protein